MSNDMSDYLRQLITSAALRKPALLAAIRTLDLPCGSNGIDVGCGAGHQCVMLAEAVGSRGHVTGLDVSNEFLAHGRMLVERGGLSEHISLQQGSADRLPFGDNTFDWAWSVDCIAHGPWDPEPMLRDIVRVVRPGGRVAILAWSSEKLLPGFPQLEAKLQATKAGLAPYREDMDPKQHFPRSLGMLRDFGLSHLRASTHAGTVHAPLDEAHRSALESLFEMRWPNVEAELDPADFSELQRLIRPDSTDHILNHPDYYAFFTYSMFWGTVSV